MSTKREFEKIIPGSMEQRVQIAKDVIAQVEAGRFVPSAGVYVRIEGNGDGYPQTEDKDAAELLSKVKQCRVCAVGSLLLAMIDRHDALKLEGAHKSLHLAASAIGDRRYLYQLFDDAREIEAAFETDNRWDDRYPNDRARMIAIMRNIIRNGGVFVVTDIPKRRKVAA